MLRRLIVSRLIDLGVVLVCVSVIVFAMIRLIPGDAVAGDKGGKEGGGKQ